MSGIRTTAAAAMLGVSPSTLRSWERRYGWPSPRRSPGGHRQYSLAEIKALRATMDQTHNVSSAIALARQRDQGPSTAARLASAFARLDDEEANRLLDESLALRSVERTIEDLLLKAVALRVANQYISAEYEFAWRYASDWLIALKRLSPPGLRTEKILILDASGPLDLDALYVQALEVILRRGGVRTQILSPAIEPKRLGRALRVLAPTAVIVSGRRITLDGVARLAFAVRSLGREPLVFGFRCAVPASGNRPVIRLGETPIAGRDALLGRLYADTAPKDSPNPKHPTAPSSHHRGQGSALR